MASSYRASDMSDVVDGADATPLNVFRFWEWDRSRLMRTAAFLAISTPLLMVPLMFHAPLGPALSCRVFGALAASGTVAMQVAVERRIHNGMPPAEALSFFTALQMGAMLPAGALLASSVQLVVRKVTTTLGKFAAGSIKSGNLLLELRIAVQTAVAVGGFHAFISPVAVPIGILAGAILYAPLRGILNTSSLLEDPAAAAAMPASCQ